MLYRIFLVIQIFYLVLYGFKFSFLPQSKVLGASTDYYEETTADLEKEISYPRLAHQERLETETAFDQKEVVEYETIPYEVSYVDDEDLE